MEENPEKKSADCSATQQSTTTTTKKRRARRVGRSVMDYKTEEELRRALDYSCSVSSGNNNETTTTTAAAIPGSGKADWLLPVPDDEAEPQSLETEVQRLLVLKSYRALEQYDDNDENDNEKDNIFTQSTAQRAVEKAAFDELCHQACELYNVPVSAISLVDLGRQFAFSHCGLPDDAPRDTPRHVAFCAHAILSKGKGITVVKDTLRDERFKHNVLVTQAPHLRFYAGAPLQSPEGYNLGTFCVEGPEPKPQGLTQAQEQKLREYAQRIVDLLVQRRQSLLDRLASVSTNAAAASHCSSISSKQSLLRHAGVTTNLGGLLYYYQYYDDVLQSSGDESGRDGSDDEATTSGSDCVTAMSLFQESVQTLMLLEDNDASSTTPTTANTNKPSQERLQEMERLWNLLSAQTNTKQSRKGFYQIIRRLFPPMTPTTPITTTTTDDQQPNATSSSSPTTATAASATAASTSATTASTSLLCPHHSSTVGGIPGLFCRSSKLKGSNTTTTPETASSTHNHHASHKQMPLLVFSEPFRISIDSDNNKGKMEPHFLVPLEQCSKATLFNMGLIHYHWGNPDTAMQFFDLASSLSQQLSPLAFDPVILGSFNNQAQILLQHYGRQADAMEMLQDALTRGNAALVALYEKEATSPMTATANAAGGGWCCRRLRRKLARTVMNMGHVHFVNCDYDAAMATCHDALRLLHTNMEDMEICAVWHNMGLIHYYSSQNNNNLHQNVGNRTNYDSKILALEYLNRFLDRAPAFIGHEHLQIAEALHIKGLIYFEGMGKLYQQSIQPLNEALRIRQARLGPNHASVAESLCVMGRLLMAREEYDFALGAFSKGIDIFRKLASHPEETAVENDDMEKVQSGLLSFDCAQTLLNIGRAYHAQGHLEDALQVYQEATEWSRRFFGHKHVYVARLLSLVGNLHLETDHVESAMQCFTQATLIYIQQKMPIPSSLVQDPLSYVQLAHHPVASMA